MGEVAKKVGRIIAVATFAAGIQAATPSPVSGYITPEPTGIGHEVVSHYEDFPKEYSDIHFISDERLFEVLGINNKTEDEKIEKLRVFRQKIYWGENRISVLLHDVKDRSGVSTLRTGIYYLERYHIGIFLYDDTNNSGESYNPQFLPQTLGRYSSREDMIRDLKGKDLSFENRSDLGKAKTVIKCNLPDTN